MTDQQKLDLTAAIKGQRARLAQTKIGDIPNLIWAVLLRLDMASDQALFNEAWDYAVDRIIAVVQFHKCEEV